MQHENPDLVQVQDLWEGMTLGLLFSLVFSGPLKPLSAFWLGLEWAVGGSRVDCLLSLIVHQRETHHSLEKLLCKWQQHSQASSENP